MRILHVMFCTYLTIYMGNKLPMFYIGSTSILKINKGYKGSVSSKEYKRIWKEELKSNQHLFRVRVLSLHNTRQEALEKENFFHKSLSVVRSTLYLNKANAIPDGVFGSNSSGKNNPMYGKSRPDSKERMKLNNPMFDNEVLKRVTESKKISREKGLHKSTRNSKESLIKSSKRMSLVNPNKIKICCIFCKTETTPSAITRYHKHERI